jgi:hypothetical protein
MNYRLLKKILDVMAGKDKDIQRQNRCSAAAQLRVVISADLRKAKAEEAIAVKPSEDVTERVAKNDKKNEKPYTIFWGKLSRYQLEIKIASLI